MSVIERCRSINIKCAGDFICRRHGSIDCLGAFPAIGRNRFQVCLVATKPRRKPDRPFDGQAIQIGLIRIVIHDRDAIAEEIGRKIRGMTYATHNSSALAAISANSFSIGSLGRSPQYRRTMRYTLIASSE